MLSGGLDGVRAAVRVIGVVIIMHAKVGAGFGPNVVGFRRMHTGGRVNVRFRIGDLVADAGGAIHQAIDERRRWILKDLLGAGLGAGLGPVVILHRDYEHRFHGPRLALRRAREGDGSYQELGEHLHRHTPSLLHAQRNARVPWRGVLWRDEEPVATTRGRAAWTDG